MLQGDVQNKRYDTGTCQCQGFSGENQTLSMVFEFQQD